MYVVVAVLVAGFAALAIYLQRAASFSYVSIAAIFGCKIVIEALAASLLPNPLGSQYEFLAQALIDETIPVDEVLGSVNYPGVILFYASLQYVSGSPAVVPLLANALISLSMCALLVRMVQLAVPGIKNTWLIMAITFMPDAVLYDAVMSKETLTTALTVFIIYLVTAPVLRNRTVSLMSLVLVLIASFALGMVRNPSVLITSIVSLTTVLALSWGQRQWKWRAIFTSLAPALMIWPAIWLNDLLRGGQFFTRYVQAAAQGETYGDYYSVQPQDFELSLSRFVDSGLSLSSILSPGNPLELIAFAPIRAALTLAAPLGSLSVVERWLTDGDEFRIEAIASGVSAVLVIVVLPSVLWLVLPWLRKSIPSARLVCLWLPGLLGLVLAAAGTVIIHDRYRLPWVPFLMASGIAGLVLMPPRRRYWLVLGGVGMAGILLGMSAWFFMFESLDF